MFGYFSKKIEDLMEIEGVLHANSDPMLEIFHTYFLTED